MKCSNFSVLCVFFLVYIVFVILQWARKSKWDFHGEIAYARRFGPYLYRAEPTGKKTIAGSSDGQAIGLWTPIATLYSAKCNRNCSYIFIIFMIEQCVSNKKGHFFWLKINFNLYYQDVLCAFNLFAARELCSQRASASDFGDRSLKGCTALHRFTEVCWLSQLDISLSQFLWY